MAAPLVPILIGKTIYHISKPLYKKYAPRLTKATKKAVEEAGSITKIGSNKLIKLLGGQNPTKASLSQKGVKQVVGKGAAGTFATGVVVGALLPKGKGSKYTPPGGTLAPLPRQKGAKKSKFEGVKPGRKPVSPIERPAPLKPGTGEKKAPKLPKAKEIKSHPTPPKNMKNPMIMESGSKTYANSSRPTNYKD